MRINFVLLAFLLLTKSAFAQPFQYDFVVLPAAPVANQPFQIQVNLSALSCIQLPDSLVASVLAGNVVEYALHVPASCFPFPAQERVYPVAPLPAGTYIFRFVYCPHANPPLPNETCSTISEQSVTVGGALAPEPSMVPSMSMLGLLSLAGFAVLVGWAALRKV